LSGARVAFAPGVGAVALVVLTSFAAMGAAVWLRLDGVPVRGYTTAGLVAGVLALLAMVLAAAYSWRKRAGQEHSRGPLSAWLAWHLVLSALAIAAAWLHSGAHFDGRTGTWTAVLLLLTLGSGVFGLMRYLRVPGQVLADVGNLAPGTLELEIRRLEQRRDLLLAGGEVAGASATVAAIDADIAERRGRLARQAGYRGKLRGWLWLHIPASIALVVALAWHVGATWRTAFPAPATSPLVFESAQDCKGCHKRQFDEWSGSMHAMAMQSPLTDIQNRLVLALEAEQKLDKVLVGDLCVRCHAPNAYLGAVQQHEPIAAPVSARARITAEGITCTTCHRMTGALRCDSPGQVAGDTFRHCEGGADPDQARQFYNANNLVFATGRAYYGPFAATGAAASVGNRFHRGMASAHAGASLEQRSAACASCHTVQVHDPAEPAKVLVRLQDTYQEWLESGRTGKIAWNEQFACADCHNARFERTIAQIDRWQADRACLAERVGNIRTVMAEDFAAMPLRTSAEPADGFDRPLQPRTRLDHAFTGVDIHLEPSFPAKHYPAFDGVTVPTRAALENTAALLRRAAAIRVADVAGGTLRVDVANLATGHTLPAGFAFARELWVEVAVSRSDAGDDFEVVVGGRDGRPLRGGELLDKTQPGLRNFQKVLFNAPTGQEVVLQNQATAVLVGAAANAAGFRDRVPAIEPGDIRALEIDLGAATRLDDVRRVRVRLRFRSLPPEFLTKMAALADARGRTEDAARLRAMVGHLHVFEVAEDVRSVAGGPDCITAR
jgi:hypothetical protein